MIAGVVAVLVAVAVAFLDSRTPLVEPPGSMRQTPADAAERAVLLRLRALLSLLALAAGWTVVGGLFGCAVGGIAAVFSWRALTRLESPAVGRRRRELERDLPVAVHLLAACLSAGAATTGALEAVAEAVAGPAGEELALVRRRLHWGADPAEVWRSLGGPLEELGRRMARAHESGASVERAVTRLAEEMRATTKARAEAQARTVEVRAAAPLGLCFLPAFVLLGVVPLAAGLFSAISLFN